MNELRNRGVEDILLAVVDGTEGVHRCDQAVFPEAMVQTCIVHLLRHSLDFVSYKDRKPVAAALKGSTGPSTRLPARRRSAPSRKGTGAAAIRRSPKAGGAPGARSCRSTPSPPTCAGSCTTTNAIEALNAMLRRAVRARGHFPTDESAMKLLFLVLNRSEKEWKMGPREWVDGQGAVRRHVRRTLHKGMAA